MKRNHVAQQRERKVFPQIEAATEKKKSPITCTYDLWQYYCNIDDDVKE